jgi:uncharacterized protein with NRDE domain
MCTVVFIPNKQKILFASLRDESPVRSRATIPDVCIANNISFLSPKDSLAGGTWIGANSAGNVIILLNGGFANHYRKAVYLKSRGIIVSELLAIKSPVAAWENIKMEGVEPFTLIVWSNSHLFQLVWDGVKKHTIIVDKNLPHIWSSSTLYSDKVKKHREELFQQWIAGNHHVSKLSMLNFFKTFTNPENGFIMNRDEKIKTLSYTSIEINHNNAIMSYYDFLANTHHDRSIASVDIKDQLAIR